MMAVPPPAGVPLDERPRRWLGMIGGNRGIALLAGLITLLSFALFIRGLNRFRAFAQQQQRAALVEKTSMARHALEPILADLRSGRTTREAALEAARERLRTLCFEDAYGPNYIFLNGMDGRVILRPFRTQDEGLPNAANVQGGTALQEVIPQLRKRPEGVFHAYPFPNPKTRQLDDKLSFFQVVPELDVMIGTGAYLSEASRAQLATLRFEFLLFLILLLLFLAPLALALNSLRAQNLRLAREVGERRRIESTLKAVFDSAPVGLASMKERRFLEVNETFARIFQRDRAEFPGQSSRMVYPSDTDFQLAGDILYGPPSPSEAIEVEGQRADGTKVTLLVRTAPLELEGGSGEFVTIALDIAGQKATEAALRASEARLKLVLDTVPQSVFWKDHAGTFLGCNEAFARAAGFGHSSEIVGRSDFDMPWGEHAEAYRADDRAVVESGRPKRHLTEPFRDAEGRELWVDTTKVPLEDEKGEVLGVLGLFEDVTERKKAEEAFLEAEQRLTDIVNFLPDATFAIDPEGKVILWNRAMEEMTGVDARDMLSRGDYEYAVPFYGARRPILIDLVFAYEKDGEAKYDFVQKVGDVLLAETKTTVRGREIALWGTARPLYDTKGMVIGAIESIRDITLQRRTQEEILHLKNYLSNVIDSMPSAIVGLDHEGCVTQWNRAAEELLGVPAVVARGRLIGEVAKDFTPWIASLRQEILRGHRSASVEKLPLEREGERSFFELMLYPLVADGMEGAVIRIQDITERVRIQELMIQTEKMMSVGGLAAGMAHEINNPLGIISQAAQNIERRLLADLPANSVEAQELGLELVPLRSYFEKRQIPQFLGSIREAVGRAARIVSNMLQFSRQADSARHPASLTELMEQALDLAANDYDLRKKFDFRSIEIRREFEPGLPSVPVVAIEIEQVLLNLLKNAAQAMVANPPGKPPCLVLRARRDPKHVVLEIEDNGTGMEEATRRRVFEPFFTTKEPGVGTGLGLSVSYTIITQNHKGLMEVASSPGRGSRFTVRLPAMREREDV